MSSAVAPRYAEILSRRVYSPLWSILLRVSSLSTGEEILTDQVRNKDLVVVTETLRVSMDTGILPSVTSRYNLKATVIPVGPLNRRTRRTVGWLTGGRGVDMKDKRHSICPFSSKSIVHDVPLLSYSPEGVHTSYGVFPTVSASINTARAIPTQSRTHFRSFDALTCATTGLSIAGFTRSWRMGLVVGSLMPSETFERKEGKSGSRAGYAHEHCGQQGEAGGASAVSMTKRCL